MNARHLVVVGVLATLVACGDGPPPPPPGPSPCLNLTISPATDLIKIKGSEAFTATCTGSSNPVQPTWGSDTPSVATIDSNGRATGVTSGITTLFADYQGLRGTRRLRVVPDYHGKWRGDYRLNACSDSGDWQRAGFCRDLPIGSLDLFDLALTQSGAAATANVDFGGLPGRLDSGTIREDGHLALSGSYSVTIEGVPVPIVVTVTNWDTISTDNERMTGRFTLAFEAAGLNGSVRVECELRIVTKTSSTPLMATGSEGRGLGRAIARVLRKR